MHTVPRKVIWEITQQCNMYCRFYSTSSQFPGTDELTTEEALGLCDELAQGRIQSVTLSGGEPLLREDWHLLAEKLVKAGIQTDLITDGGCINDDVIEKIKSSGISRIIIHLDGLEKTHDELRKKGSHKRILSACKMLNRNNISPILRTTVTNRSLKELPKLKKIINKFHISSWQLRAAMPWTIKLREMFPRVYDGKQKKQILFPEHLTHLIDFCYQTMKEETYQIEIGDEIGYFSVKDTEIRKKVINPDCFFSFRQGCPAGKSEYCILPNGDITPCAMLRDNDFIAGNVKTTSLEEIRKMKGTFSAIRDLKKSDLKGFCAVCRYGAYCLGGCCGAKIAFTGSIYENITCVFKLSIEKERNKAHKVKDIKSLISTGRALIDQKAFQIAEVYLRRAHTLDPYNLEVLDLLGFVHFFLENYSLCRDFNEMALRIKPNHAYAHKGLGLACARLGELEKGIKLLYKAIDLADISYTDPYYDLAVILSENNRIAEALHILGVGRNLSSRFRKTTDDFYRSLIMKLKNH